MKRSTFTAASLASLTLGRAAGAAPAQTVAVLYAGSLVTVMERSLVPALAKLGIALEGEGKGSLALANLIRSGLRQPDVFISADPAVLDGLMGGSHPFVNWGLTFATTRLVIGYARHSHFAADFADAARGSKNLLDVLLTPGLRLGRTDPTLDPKGYRTIIATRLLGAHAHRPDFAQKLLGEDRNAAQILPEETLLARLESDDVDAAFLYSTEAVARGVPFVELPASANLGDPVEASTYASTSVTIDGTTHRGGVAAYALTIPLAAPHPVPAARFVAYLFSKDGRALLERDGVTMIAPTISGDRSAVPSAVRDALPASAPAA